MNYKPPVKKLQFIKQLNAKNVNVFKHFFKLYFFEITVFMKTGDIIYPTSNILVKKSFFNQKIENAAFLCLN